MENQNFVCPHCSKKQPLKKLLLLSNFSKWNCPYCRTEIAPEKKGATRGAVYGVLGALSTAIPANYCLYIAKLQPSQKHADNLWLWNYLLCIDYHSLI